MIIRSPATLDLFRSPGRCQLCRKPCSVREGHHYLARGMGGGNQLDVEINLIALGSSGQFECECHTRVHGGNISRAEVLAVIAKRENAKPGDIEEALYFLTRLPKDASEDRILELLRELDSPVEWLARRELLRHGVLSIPF